MAINAALKCECKYNCSCNGANRRRVVAARIEKPESRAMARSLGLLAFIVFVFISRFLFIGFCL